MNQDYYWESVFILFLQVSTQNCQHTVRKPTKFQGMTQTNLSIFLFQFIHHNKIREIIEISPLATRNPATLSQLRSICEVSHLDPPVNHSIFRTEA